MIVQPHNIDMALPATNPVLVHMLGIPGAGKSTFLDILQKRWNMDSPPCLLGFDQIMTHMPEYQAIGDKQAAFAACELPAREMGYGLLDTLIHRRAHILFDNGGSSAHHLDLLQQAIKAGYHVALVSITVPLDVAQQRIHARTAENGRTTPLHYLEERQTKLTALEEKYRHLTPSFYHLHNEGNTISSFIDESVALADRLLHDFAMIFNTERNKSSVV